MVQFKKYAKRIAYSIPKVDFGQYGKPIIPELGSVFLMSIKGITYAQTCS